MELYELIEKHGKGKGDAVMWETTRLVSDFIKPIKETDKKGYWSLMRRVYGLMSGGHYNEEFALHDVAQIEYTDKDGKSRKGAYWTCEQVEEATKGMTFPSGTTTWDIFVAMNSFRADTCKILTDEQVVKTAHQFYFADEDFPKERGSKIWRYMQMVHD